MKLEIDTTKKTICILEETSILEVMNFLKSLESEDYKIICKEVKTEYNPIQYLGPPVPPFFDPYNHYQVTCNT